jgi:hypothetical protein
MIPLPLHADRSFMMECCSKVVCSGCCHANAMREKQGSLFPASLENVHSVKNRHRGNSIHDEKNKRE